MMSDEVLRDGESGLLNEAYFSAALPNRVATARRVLRPLSLALLSLGEPGLGVSRCAPEVARDIAYALLQTLRESDTPIRRADGGFALVLEDTPEDGALWTVERVRRLLSERGVQTTIWAGIAAYPAHALEARDLVERAERALRLAEEWGQSRSEVALPADSI
jgi:PleD family two-component response regulator